MNDSIADQLSNSNVMFRQQRQQRPVPKYANDDDDVMITMPL